MLKATEDHLMREIAFGVLIGNLLTALVLCVVGALTRLLIVVL